MNPTTELIALASHEGPLTWIALALFVGAATFLLYRALGLAFSGDRSRRLGVADRTLSRRRHRSRPRDRTASTA